MSTRTDHLWRHFTAAGAPQLVIERGEGCYIWDNEGNRYLDALSALYCVNIGYGPWPGITEAAQKQLDQLPFFTNWVGFATPPALELAEKVTELVPIDVGRIFFVGGGSEAIETALKVARQYHRLRGEPTRYKFVTRRSAYHGTTLGALSVNGSASLRQPFEPLLPGCLRAPTPYEYRCPIKHCDNNCDCTCLEAGFDLFDQASVGAPAAVVAEPVLSAGGVIVPPPGYFLRLAELCADRGMALILDECQTGLGRLGAMYGFERYDVVPDYLVLSKTLGAVCRSARS